MKVVKLLDQASEDGPRDSLREQVGDHHDCRSQVDLGSISGRSRVMYVVFASCYGSALDI